MITHEVNSSLISRICHDADSNTLVVTFRRGNEYTYSDVDKSLCDAMLASPSIGIFYNQHIKSRAAIQTVTAAPQPVSTPEIAAVQVDSLRIAEAPAPALEAAKLQTHDLVFLADSIAISSSAAQDEAGHYLLDVKMIMKQIEDHHRPMKDAAHKAHRTICEQESSLLAPLKAAELVLKGKIGRYVFAQQEAARAEEARLRAEARAEAERVAKVEAEERALRVAIELSAEGKHDDADTVLAFPAPVALRYIAPAPVIAEVARTSGVSTRKVIRMRVVNESLVPREYMLVNEKALAEVGKRTGGKVQIPGVEFYEEAGVSVATGRRA